MNEFARAIADAVRQHVVSELEKLPDQRAELRVFFHGPPAEFLQRVLTEIRGGRLETVAANGDPLAVPVLLQMSRLEVGQVNPPIGEPGVCDSTHLMALRNSPACRQYVVLVPPGVTHNLSIASARSDFGVSSAVNAANSTFTDWWSDPFIQELVATALAKIGIQGDRGEAVRLVELGLIAAEGMRIERSRLNAWRVLARLFDAPPRQLVADPSALLCYATGFPLPTQSIDARKLGGLMDRLADELSSGFRLGIQKLQQDASEGDKSALDAFLEHLESRCELLTAFARSAPAFYSPAEPNHLGDPPEWWFQLTAEKWLELLDDPDIDPKDGLSIGIESIVPLVRGGTVVVSDVAAISVRNTSGEAARVRVERFQGASRTPQQSWESLVADKFEFADDQIGIHNTPLRYVASADGFRSATIKVVALETWAPSVYVTARSATKIVPTRAARQNREGIRWECTLQVAGAGRHFVDIYASSMVALAPEVVGRDAAGEESGENNINGRVEELEPGRFGVELDVQSDAFVDVVVLRAPQSSRELLRVHINCEDVALNRPGFLGGSYT